MSTPDIAIGSVRNIFVRQMYFAAVGDIENGHAHPFDHLSLLASGSVAVKIGDNEATTFTAPAMIYIEKDIEHEITALQAESVLYCVHALRDAETQDIVDASMMPQGSQLYALAVAATRG